MGGCGSLFICLSLCLSVGPARGCGWGGGGVGGGRGLSTVRGKRRWQVEVRAEQFSTVGVEVQRGIGVEGGAGVRAGVAVVKETVICPRPGPYPQSSTALLFLSFPIGKIFPVL